MTWKQWTIEQMESRGMWPKDCETVFAIIESHQSNESMKGRWNDSIDGYPPQMKAVCLMAITRIALEWIDANMPKAWFRPMFE